ncbi:uncharacterized protein F5147DRAFT_694062, partial [Suillus discolor]
MRMRDHACPTVLLWHACLAASQLWLSSGVVQRDPGGSGRCTDNSLVVEVVRSGDLSLPYSEYVYLWLEGLSTI